ncbi:MAG: hypothetical protein Ta2F_08580 [Termitinemataceae bacterium]|nr:MAG: hypothetical protein Ta2F_08580 [Termitinemataceae bacterium]
MKKILFFIIILVVVSTASFAQRGFYVAGGTGVAFNNFSLNPTDINRENKKTNGMPFGIPTDFNLRDLPLTLELGGYFMEYVGMGLSSSYNVNISAKAGIDPYALKVNWKNPHFFLFVFGNIPVGNYLQINIGAGPLLSYYSGTVGNHPSDMKYTLKGFGIGVGGRLAFDVMLGSGLYFSFATTGGISATKGQYIEISYEEPENGYSYTGSVAGSKLAPHFAFKKSYYIAPTILVGYKFGYWGGE